MAMGQARDLHKSNNLPVLIVGRDGRPVKSDLFNGVPYIIDRPRGRPHTRLMNGPGVRPYIVGKTANNWTWRPFKPTPAEIVFTPAELAFAEPYRGRIMFEPNGKDIGHTNKAWFWDRWVGLSRRTHVLFEQKVIQCGAPGARRLSDAQFVETATFRQALAVLSVCRAFVGCEGGLHHGAAAVGTPAVVIFGGFISPQATGYRTHRNLFTGSGLGCGNRLDCGHCREAMSAITVDEVSANLLEIA